MFVVDITIGERETVIRLDGDLVAATPADVDGVITNAIAANARRIVLELANPAFVEPTVLGYLAELSQRAARSGAVLVVRNPTMTAARSSDRGGASAGTAGCGGPAVPA